MITVMIFAVAVINIPFIVQDPTRWWNWAALVFSFGAGIVSAKI